MDKNDIEKALIELIEKVEKNSTINKDLYKEYDVRHGLRNPDGTGVLVGITHVGNVIGYEREDDKKVPVEGDIRYRGYSVKEIVEDLQENDRYGFEEITYLLLFGELPNKVQLNNFNQILIWERTLPSHFLEDDILKIPGKNIMNKMMRSMLALYSYDDNPDDTSTGNVLKQSISLISKIPLLMAYSYQAKKHYIDGSSLIIHFPDQDKGIAQNILHLIRDDSEYTEEEARILDLMLIIQAEHGGGNNSAFATSVVSSTDTDTYSAIAAGLASLKGPRHGGANLKVVDMIDDLSKNIRSSSNKEDIENYLVKVLNKEAYDGKGLIYGLGHAVYTKSDPRAVMLKEQAVKLAHEKGYDEKLELLENIETIGGRLLQEKKNLDYPVCPNVDFYSGFVYEMLGINKDLYTPLFAVARTAGWCAHRLEQIQDSKIIRPAYLSLVPNKKYIKFEDRFN